MRVETPLSGSDLNGLLIANAKDHGVEGVGLTQLASPRGSAAGEHKTVSTSTARSFANRSLQPQRFRSQKMGDAVAIALSSAARCSARSPSSVNFQPRVSNIQRRLSCRSRESTRVKRFNRPAISIGKAAIIASRIAARTRGGEILAFSTLKQLTENSGDLRLDAGRDVELKSLVAPFAPTV